jgi:hypothetical protein
MMWRAYLRRLAACISHDTRRKKNPPSQGPRRPRLECLEDRTLLSTLTVGAGDVTGLIAAINTANTDSNSNINDTISLTNSTYTLSAVNNPTNGANGLPVITAKNLVIQGNGATITRSTANGTPAFRLFDVASGAGLTLQSLTVSNGLASGTTAQGGGLFNNGGNVTLTGAAFKSDVAQGGAGQNAQGGGLYSSGGSLTLKNDTFSNDKALGGNGTAAGQNGAAGQGGGLYVSNSTVTILNTTLASNTSPAARAASPARAVAAVMPSPARPAPTIATAAMAERAAPAATAAAPRSADWPPAAAQSR